MEKTLWHLVLITMMFGLLISSGNTWSASEQTHHGPEGFRNLYEHSSPDFLDFLKWRWRRLSKNISPIEACGFPVAKNDPAFLKANRKKTTLTWIGHATVLVQIHGKNILTDPHFSKRASPVQWAGPKRVVEPGLSMELLPPIDMVLISHDHYDSLDKPSILALHHRTGGKRTAFFVPLGLKAWFRDLGIQQVYELDWWEKQPCGDLEMIAVPARHWSKRRPFERNKTLWAGWIVRRPGFSFFFCGDTGYSRIFKEIGDRFGPMALSAIPIGAYAPRPFMHGHHVSPEEAVQIHLDVQSRKSVAIHWGTFALADEPLDEPPERLKKALAQRGMSKNAFLVLQHGQTIVVGTHPVETQSNGSDTKRKTTHSTVE
ncbi:MAG: MBL fold metallo-hydrolase [Deltaproteobacteria bacterium]|nr:MBL fold metallo-hydrolase [Deltaproteobacteria bacterium]